MSTQEEPSYLAFARANVREGFTSSPNVVRELLARIDRDASALKAANDLINACTTEPQQEQK